MIRNRAQCLKCGEIVESKYRWDSQTCRCGNLNVDGGKDYRKRTAVDFKKVKELE